MRLYVPSDHVSPCAQLALRRFEHGVGLAYPRCHAKKNLQLAAFGSGILFLQCRQQHVRIRSLLISHRPKVSSDDGASPRESPLVELKANPRAVEAGAQS